MARLTRRRYLQNLLAVVASAAAGCDPRDPQRSDEILFWMWEAPRNWRRIAHLAGVSETFTGSRLKFMSLDRSQVRSKLLTSLAAGVGLPDITRLDLAWYRPFVSNRGARDLTEHVEDFRSDIIPSALESSRIDGRIYSIPQDLVVYQMGYRVDLFERAGLPTEPDAVSELWATYDGFLDVGRTLMKRTGAYILNIDPTETFWNYDIVQLAGSTGMFDKHGEVIFDSDFHVEATEVWRSLFDSGLVSRFAFNSPAFWSSVRDNRQACRVWASIDDYRTRDFAPAQGGKWRVAKLPRVNAASQRVAGGPATVLVVPRQRDLARLETATDVAIYLGLSRTGMWAYGQVLAGSFPSYLPAVAELRGQKAFALSEQGTYEWFGKVLAEETMLPWYRTSAHYSAAWRSQKDAVFSVLVEGEPVRKSLKSAADDIRRLQRLTRMT